MTNPWEKDKPKIQGLTNDIHGVNIAWVGQGDVTRIEETEKPGQMAMVPWYEVYKGEDLHMEVNAAQIGSVVYFPPNSVVENSESAATEGA